MIKQYGKVIIKKDYISISHFCFDAADGNFTSCEVEALEWACKRIESALRHHKIKFTPKRTLIITEELYVPESE